MTAEALDTRPARRRRRGMRLIGVAHRDLRGQARGFAVFTACIALGVMAITAIGGLSDALDSAFSRQGRVMLGGDVSASRIHKRAGPGELAQIERHGAISEIATLRAMARPAGDAAAEDPANDGARFRSVLVGVKAVDAAYPLVGDLQLDGPADAMTRLRDERAVAADPLLLERLGLEVGDTLRIGDGDVIVVATVVNEPDRFSGRAAFGPRVFMSLAALEASDLAQPGSLVRWRYRVLLEGADSGGEAVARVSEALESQLASAGFGVRDRRDPVPGVRRAIERFSQFMTLVGLTAMLVGGLGVANAVASYMEHKRNVIATFRSLGASGREIFAIYLAEVLALAAVGIVIGLVLGYAVPWVGLGIFGDRLPLALSIVPEAGTILLASAYGLLVSLLFILWPLGRLERVRPAVLFREQVAGGAQLPPLFYMTATALIGFALAGFAIANTEQHLIALYFCLGIAGFFGLFALVAKGVTLVAARLPRIRRPEIALAIRNLAGPDALTGSVVLSLGAGLSLLVAVTLADRALVNELQTRIPENAPSYFFLDIPKQQSQAFRQTVKGVADDVEISDAPMLRGRIVELDGQPVDEIEAPPDAAWVLRGDRGLTYFEDVPEGSQVIAGEWWPAGYDGPPLVSFEEEIAKGLGVSVGDTITVNVLGRNITATIANLRQIKWESLAINFVMIFSPNTLAAAPFNVLATVTHAEPPDVATEARLINRVSEVYPQVTSIRVRDAINAVNAIFAQVMMAVQVAGGLTLLAGAIVLAGALATAQRRRIYLAVVLKTLGATRWRILLANAAEYLILALVTSIFAAALGTVAAWIIVTQILEVTFVFSMWAVMQSILLASALVLVFGGIGTWRVLNAPAVPHLRAE